MLTPCRTDHRPCARSLDRISSELLSYSHLLLPSFKVKPPISTQRWTWRVTGPFIRSSSHCGHNEQIPPCFSLILSSSVSDLVGHQASLFRASLAQALTLTTPVTKKLKAATALSWAMPEQESQERMLSSSRWPEKELGAQFQSCLGKGPHDRQFLK